MRDIVAAEGEFWRIPDAHVQVPACDLFVEHWKTSAEDGDEATLNISVGIDTIEYKSVFFDGVARFYIGEQYKFNAHKYDVIYIIVGLDEFSIQIWHGAEKSKRILPSVLFSEKNTLAMIPDSDGDLLFHVKIADTITQYSDLTYINIPEIEGSYATVWVDYPEATPTNVKSIRILPVCDDDKEVFFILQNGEHRTWHLKERRKTSSFKELTSYSDVVSLPENNEETRIFTDGENEITTTLFISGLRKSELDEIAQLAVSRYVEIDGVRAEIIRKSAVISGNSQGGVFTIDVKGSL